MRIPHRTSRWAIWARRLASVALPFEIIPVFMHRERLLQSDTFTILFSIGVLLALLTIFVSLISFARLWQSGFRGWARTAQAFIMGLALIVPLVVAMNWAMTYPPTNDVATAGTVPELIMSQSTEDRRLSPEATLRAFPTVVSRTYALSPHTVFALIARLVNERQWEIRLKREPVEPAYPGRLHALAMTLLGFRDEVAILVSWTSEGAMVSMRSASLFGLDDLGANGRRIEDFLSALDQAVTDAQRQGPIIEGLTPGSEPQPESAAVPADN